MSAAINLQERRALLPTDARNVIDAIVEGAESLHAAAASLPLSPIRESALIGIERHLVSLSVLLSNLRRHVPASGAK
ncbi:MAG: hypothetical protein ABIR10_16985 [Dokdonella sp.]